MRNGIFLLGFLLNGLFIHAQNTETGNWFIYFGNQKINHSWNWWNEVQYRNYNIIGDLQQLLFRTGMGYNLTENNNNFLVGYGFVHSQNYDIHSVEKVGSDEHRLFQQFLTKQNFGRIFLQHRFRIEERFLKNDFQMRFRYFLGINIPINRKTMDGKTFYFSAYEEIFLNPLDNIFDRNRFYSAFGYVFNSVFKVEVGFMAQTLADTNRNQFQIVLFNNFPFRKSRI